MVMVTGLITCRYKVEGLCNSKRAMLFPSFRFDSKCASVCLQPLKQRNSVEYFTASAGPSIVDITDLADA